MPGLDGPHVTSYQCVVRNEPATITANRFVWGGGVLTRECARLARVLDEIAGVAV